MSAPRVTRMLAPPTSTTISPTGGTAGRRTRTGANRGAGVFGEDAGGRRVAATVCFGAADGADSPMCEAAQRRLAAS